MYKLTLENAHGNSIIFNDGAFTIKEIQGLNPPEATINTSNLALMDGEKFISAKVNMRQINIAFAIETDAEINRINLYKVLKSKQYVKLTYVSEYRNVFIEGYIQSIPIDYFAMKQTVTCSILCPSPYFKEAQLMINEMQNVISNFHFAFQSVVSKNLLPITAETTTMNDVTFTINDDGTVTVDGTASASAYIALNADLEAILNVGDSYYMTGCPSGGSVETYRMQFWYNGIGSGGYDTGEGVMITPTDNLPTSNIAIYINAGVQMDNVTFYPMIRSADVTDDTFEAYNQNPDIVFGYFSDDVGIYVENDGDVECGLIIELYARDTISNPKIFDYDTGEFIGLNVTMQTADLITIDTRQGNKSVTLLRNGATSNIFNTLMKNITWLQLSANGNTFVYEVGSGTASNLIVTFNHYNLFEGV